MEKFIVDQPTFKYDLDADGNKGSVNFTLKREDEEKYDLENYSYEFTMGADTDNPQDNWTDWINAISEMKLSELNILNSTDYLRAIYDFDELVDANLIHEKFPEYPFYPTEEDYTESKGWA